MREYLDVSTRPVEANDLGLGLAAAVKNLSEFLRVASLSGGRESVALRLRQIVATTTNTVARRTLAQPDRDQLGLLFPIE